MISQYVLLAALAAEPAKDAPTLQLGGFVHLDAVAFRQSSVDELDPSTRAPLNEDRILLRRGRIRIGTQYKHVTGRFELDTSTAGRAVAVRPFEAIVAVHWPQDSVTAKSQTGDLPSRTAASPEGPAFHLTLGLMRIPFGFEAYESATTRPFLERTTMVQAFFPGARDFGLAFDTEIAFLRGSIALMNGQPIGEPGYGGLDTTRAKDIVGRLGIETKLAPSVVVETGFSALSGRGLHRGTPSTKDSLVWRDENDNGLVESSELHVIPGAPAQPSQTFTRFAVGYDARLTIGIPTVGKLAVRGEIIWANNLDRGVRPADPIAAGRDNRELGFYLGLSQELTQYAQVAVRYDVYDPDRDARRSLPDRVVPSDARFSTWSFAAIGRIDGARFFAQYDHNRNMLGRDASGAPARLRDDALTFRAEVVF